jgi:hypothetical protein
VDTPERETITALEILATFSDEPDWEMDQGLFLIERYGYGDVLYGGTTGLSSQAPFHMAFLWENPLLVRALPWLRVSYLEERVQVFSALAGLAFAYDAPYWGWRFKAWAMHYLQDLTQPYHARAFPLRVRGTLVRSLRERSVRALVEHSFVRLRNHHNLFEAAVHFLLNDLVKRKTDNRLLAALAGTGDTPSGSVSSVMKRCSSIPAKLAPRIDRALVRLFSDPRMDDPSYLLDEDDAYCIEETLPAAAAARPEQFQEFLGLVRDCLIEAGRVTRFFVSPVGAPHCNRDVT